MLNFHNISSYTDQEFIDSINKFNEIKNDKKEGKLNLSGGKFNAQYISIHQFFLFVNTFKDTITHLILHKNCLTNDDAIMFANNLKYMVLENLDLSKNEITDIGWYALFNILQSTKLRILNLSNNKLKTESFECLVKNLNSESKLKELYLDSLKFDSEFNNSNFIDYIVKILENNSSLEHLSISSNKIKTKGSIEIANALIKNTNLQCLNLSNNYIFDLEPFIKTLKDNKILKSLDLSNNYLMNEPKLGFFINNTGLTSFNFSYNDASCQTINSLLLKLSENKTLTNLNLIGNVFPTKLFTSLINILEKK